jgi:N-acetylmuramoyl-L-alanine amidase
MSRLILFDLGHGGIDPETHQYVTAPNKQHFHHDFGWFYEGEWNRKLMKQIDKLFKQYNSKAKQNEQIRYNWYPYDHQDIPLYSRVLSYNEMTNAQSRAVIISLHANASPNHNGRGFEIFTSKGETLSDQYATIIGEEFKADPVLVDSFAFRTDYASDGDLDKEADFYVLRKTVAPAVLVEHGFFDNLEDAALLINTDIINRFANMYLRFAIKFMFFN